MGKHIDHLNRLRKQKNFEESNYRSIMGMFGS